MNDSPYPLVLFYPGNGTEHMLPVKYISDFAIGPTGDCAFCEGDPCAEGENAPDRIVEYMSSQWAETCPFCKGRAS